ncbi:acetyl-CoA carboxylase biotin carboxyl carrier protein subunit [Staphylococcus muscae]|uniref:Acetyl-CoA carboxylase biotin carboxyl carrier protein subunit n=1 Tax=Staphylococcus muscae TaxID=1294 RepID=A0A240C438_9STAP|nr:biotin/lipoyl-containing protein [Staphylococcus muscae]AVQ33027.1 acetyl-CoA carboxylase biotin carboxyl carrier protein subunit [Staphylococcus muscae]PNZ05568.1 acetyl-CoA carboxylase biotin carboxyl carrier protein subunit [Staphylococcus muscae]GGA88951.1 acetyl-CoA carboxylase biotin carboxyl carrier protein subunit [Staphylococcus muscae]SNW02382.1 acetyl-CoA carboxylase, biotin carboxyl carrier protein [Staphylococcus muscae]
MDLKQIEQTLTLLKTYGVKHFRYGDEDMELELDLPATQQSEEYQVSPQAPVQSASQVAQTQEETSEDTFKEIRSQMIGTFYLQDEKELTKPVIKVGDVIQKGDIIGYVEAMKVMNEVTADESGEIVEILVDHGENIEHNQCIVKLK